MENKENKENNKEFENIEKENIKKQEEDNINENFFSAAFENIGRKLGSKLDSAAKVGRKIKQKLKSTFSKENMRSVGNKIKYATSKEGLRNAGKKISNAGSSIKTKALGLRVSSNMNSFYMLKLKDVLEKYSGSNDNEDFALKIQESMKDYEGFVSEKIKLWLNNNEEREKALGDKIKVGYDELKKKYDNLDYKWLEKEIPSFSKKIRIEILKGEGCINALRNHLGTYGKIDPLWDILTRGSKITRSGALKSKTINLLFTMTDSLSTYAGDNPMDVGVYSNSLMSYLLKNFKGKGEDKGQDWKLKCGLLLVRYSQQEGSYFESLGKMVDERVNKIQKSISITKQLSKLQKSCKTIPEMLDKASGSKKGTASIAIGVGMSYSNSVAIDVLKKVYTSLKLDKPDTKDIQDNSADSINGLVDKIKEIIGDDKISQYDTNVKYQKWADSLFKIVNIGNEDGILNKIKPRQHLKDFNNEEEAFKEYMEVEYKKTIKDRYGETLKEYENLLEELKKDLGKYSGDDFGGGTNPSLFKMAKKNLKEFKYMLSDQFIEDEINKELKNYNTKKAENKTKKLGDYNTEKVKNKKSGIKSDSDSGKKSEIKNKEEKKSENNSDSAKESEINNQDVNNSNEEKKSKDNSDSEKEEEKEKEIKNEEVPNLKEEKEVKNETKSDSNSEQEKNKEEIETGSNSEKGKAINESSSKEENEKEKASNSEEKEEVETDKSSSNSVDGKKKSDI